MREGTSLDLDCFAIDRLSCARVPFLFGTMTLLDAGIGRVLMMGVGGFCCFIFHEPCSTIELIS